MPVSPTLTEQLAATVARLYAEAEASLLARISARLAAGIDSPRWAEAQLLEVQRFRAEAQVILQRLSAEGQRAIGDAIGTAYNRGDAAALAELRDALAGSAGATLGALPGRRALTSLALDLIGQVDSLNVLILREALDAYRAVIADVVPRVLLGADTRLEAAQAALRRLLGGGITGFVDAAGRRWELASYVEMAVRTGTAHAARQGHSDRLAANGIDLVIVSNAVQECELCRPWEGKILSLSGSVVGSIRPPSEVTGEPVTVTVTASLGEAIGAGLYHPNCRHSHAAYFPGVTTPMMGTADPAGDAARQQLRYLERGVRSWKRRQALALSPADRAADGAKVREWQARLREHVASTSAKRQPNRERIGVAR